MIAAVAVLVVLALPTLDLELGAQDDGELPKGTEARDAYDLLSRGFGPGYTGPLLIAVDFGGDPAHRICKLNQAKEQQEQAEQAAALGEPVSQKQQRQLAQEEAFYKSKASDPRLVKLEQGLEGEGRRAHLSGEGEQEGNGGGVHGTTARTAPASEPTEDLVRDLRANVIPDATKGTSLTAYVGGETGYIDLASRISDKLPSVIAIVVALAFVLLMLAFRSILVLTSAVMNLLSVLAAYGV